MVARAEIKVSERVQTLLQDILDNDAEDSFHLLCHFYCDEMEALEAYDMLGRALMPWADFDGSRRQVEVWGKALAERLEGLEGLEGEVMERKRLEVLIHFVAEELGFAGVDCEEVQEEADYFFPGMILSRRGDAVPLTLLYRALGAEVGMEIVGVNFPGHFFARYKGWIFDPFHGGRMVTHSECAGLLAMQNLDVNGGYLDDGNSRQILIRLLAGLLYVYDMQQDAVRHEKVNAWLRALTLSASLEDDEVEEAELDEV